jgi:hypothetical protein
VHQVAQSITPEARLTQAIAEGSYLAISHLTADIYPELADFARALSERQLAQQSAWASAPNASLGSQPRPP